MTPGSRHFESMLKGMSFKDNHSDYEDLGYTSGVKGRTKSARSRHLDQIIKDNPDASIQKLMELTGLKMGAIYVRRSRMMMGEKCS